MGSLRDSLISRWARFYEKFRRKYLCDAYTRNDREYERKRRLDDPLYLDRFGYKVYSQHDEDGIIQEIFNRIGAKNRTFIEFGVQDGLESNTHFLLLNGWRGLWIEGSKKHVKRIKKNFSGPLSTKQLSVANAFISAENINDIISPWIGGGEDEIDLLSIDIDGNDYWVWKAISCVQPRAVAIEYNAKFPPPCVWVMGYNPKHIWDKSDKHGASLKSLELLGAELGYRLAGTNTNGANAFFVRADVAEGLFAEPATAENLYNSWGHRFVASGFPVKSYLGK
jgi:hypothetical protein